TRVIAMQQISYSVRERVNGIPMRSIEKQAETVCWPTACTNKPAMETRNNNFHRSRDGRRQTCKVCRCPDKFDFNVPDEVWRRVVPREYQLGVVCLECFDSFASEKEVDYSDSIDGLYFAGDKAAFKFQT